MLTLFLDYCPCEESPSGFEQFYIARVYKRQLERMFPPPAGCRFVVTSNSHDFGNYASVDLKVPDTPEGRAFMMHVDENTPSRWDNKAEIELLPSFSDQQFKSDLANGPRQRYSRDYQLYLEGVADPRD